MCQDHPQCDALGLEGACCPTVDNVYLDCCEKDWSLAQYHVDCAAQGLEGPTCPGDNGNFAECCMPDLVAQSYSYQTTTSSATKALVSVVTILVILCGSMTSL